MLKRVSIETSYKVATDVVTLSIVIGDAQMGASIVKLDDRELGEPGEIDDLVVGKGPTIKGKTLFVKSVVTDINDMTNHTSISYELKGGAAPQTFTAQSDVENEGDSVIYRATIHLIR
jgi:hypothetical protein